MNDRSDSARPVSAAVLEAAIAWTLSLDDAASAAERDAFADWHAASDEHARAWLQLGQLDRRVAAAALPARKALVQSRTRLRQRARQYGRGLLSLALLGGLLFTLDTPALSPSYWLADQRTGTGELRTLRLVDGTLLSLNTDSAVDIDFSGAQRVLVLRRGEIAVETGHADARPFWVRTEDGRLRALGTRFLVSRNAQGTRLEVLEDKVAARPQQREDEREVVAGEQVLMRPDGLGAVSPVATGADAWTHGMLVADNVRLADLVRQLSRYRHGYLGVAPEVADLRVTGSFPLNDTDLALAALLPVLPVKVEQRTPWWVTVGPLHGS